MFEHRLTPRNQFRTICARPIPTVVPVLRERIPWACGRAAILTVRAANSAADVDDAEDDDDAPVAGKALRVERLLANLGYGKRRECQVMVKKGRATRRDGGKLKVGDKVMWHDVVLDGEELDPPSPLLVALHKPEGYVVTSPDDENITDPVVYDLLPYRFARRRPFLSCVGRLDKDTSGLLLLTDDGALLHRINSPRRGIWKVYEATLADPLTPRQAEAAARRFASGALVLEGDTSPLLPAKLEMTGERSARVAICEGRYHQVRRMFAAIGNKVLTLHRVSVGALTLGSLPEAEWRHLTPAELQLVFEGPSTEEVFGSSSSSSTPALSSSSSSSSSANGGGGDGSSTNEGSAGPRTEAAGASEGGRRLTKKEKKKGPKAASRAVKGGGGANGGIEDEDEGEDEEIEDVELLVFDDVSASGRGLYGDVRDEQDEGETAAASGRHRAGGQRRRPQQQQRRAPTVRQGSTLEEVRPQAGLDEQLESIAYGTSYENDGEAAEMVASAGAGNVVRKYREGARWRRRREALRQMLPS